MGGGHRRPHKQDTQAFVAEREERGKEEGEGEKQETQRWKAGGPQAEGAISGSKEERPAPSEPNSQQRVQTRQRQKDSHEPSLPDTTGGSEDPSKRKKRKTRGPTGGNPHGSSTCDELRQLCFAQHGSRVESRGGEKEPIPEEELIPIILVRITE